MQLVDEVRNEIKAAQKLRLPWWGVLCIIVGSMPIYLLFDHFGKFNIALPILNCIAVFGFLIVVKWKLRRFPWFWITVTILAGLHVPLILFIPWSDKWVPALAIGIIDSADFCLMLWIVSIVQKLVEGRKTGES